MPLAAFPAGARCGLCQAAALRRLGCSWPNTATPLPGLSTAWPGPGAEDWRPDTRHPPGAGAPSMEENLEAGFPCRVVSGDPSSLACAACRPGCGRRLAGTKPCWPRDGPGTGRDSCDAQATAAAVHVSRLENGRARAARWQRVFQGRTAAIRTRPRRTSPTKARGHRRASRRKSVPGDGEGPVPRRRWRRRLAGWLCWAPGAAGKPPSGPASRASLLGRGPHGPGILVGTWAARSGG